MTDIRQRCKPWKHFLLDDGFKDVWILSKKKKDLNKRV